MNNNNEKLQQLPMERMIDKLYEMWNKPEYKDHNIRMAISEAIGAAKVLADHEHLAINTAYNIGVSTGSINDPRDYVQRHFEPRKHEEFATVSDPSWHNFD